MNHLITAGIAIVVSLIVGVTVLHSVPSAPVQPVQNESQVQPTGALTGPDISTSYLRWGRGNGVRIDPTGLYLTAATTTPCDITSPASTSTLRVFTFQTTAATSSSLTMRIATSTVPNATTTTQMVAAFSGVFAYAYMPTTTVTAIFAANTHIVVGIEGVGYGPTLSGSCSAQFSVL